MVSRYLRLDVAPPEEVLRALSSLRDELGISPDFPPEVMAEAEEAAGGSGDGAAPGGVAPGGPTPEVATVDATDIPFVTVDPPGSRDLDQALHLETDGDGLRVRYAIAAVSTFVTPGGAIDREAHARGVTVYGPDGSYALHPPQLGAGVASLLEGQNRPAYLWHLRVDASGALVDARVELAVVRSRAQLTYEEVQAAHDGRAPLPTGVPADLPRLLRRFGELRVEQERARGGISLDIPEQSVVRNEHGFVLSYRATLPVEEWNAQVSLLTGMAAAAMMREAGVGILRTLPEADPRDVDRLRRTARALGVEWPRSTPYPELVRSLDSAVPAHAAFLNEATTLFRGAGYLAFGIGDETGGDAGGVEAGVGEAAGGEAGVGRARGDAGAEPTNTRHAAIAAEYAHVTAPLRRLVDRYGLAVCLAHCSGKPVPPWVLDALPGLPATMSAATRRAGAYERGAVDALEALVLRGREGEEFAGVITESDGEVAPPGGTDRDGDSRRERGTVELREVAVKGRVEGSSLPVGEEVRVRLVEADVPGRKVLFSLV
ncbi:RNB domain-containing ribonuclease [Georgenia muralis]